MLGVGRQPGRLDQPAGDGGDDVLRATNHNNPYSAIITGDFNWLLDRGQPRPAGDHYHVYRGTDPQTFTLLSALEPYTSMTYQDPTPQATPAELPLVHYYLVYAADLCEQEEPR